MNLIIIRDITNNMRYFISSKNSFALSISLFLYENNTEDISDVAIYDTKQEIKPNIVNIIDWGIGFFSFPLLFSFSISFISFKASFNSPDPSFDILSPGFTKLSSIFKLIH